MGGETMNWARAKTLLIMLLLAVNLVLGGILLGREAQERERTERALEDLCALLLQNGLTARPDRIPAVLELTYDVERSYDGKLPETNPAVRGLPVWGVAPGAGRQRLFVTPVIGLWRWDDALPIDGNFGFSAGQCLLMLTADWESTGVLELCELGFVAAPIAPDVMRLRPCWRFVISGEEYFFPAA
jgi:hypothetical protein